MASLHTANAPALRLPGTPARPEPTTGTSDELGSAATRAQTFTGGTAAAIGVMSGEIVVCCARSGASAPEPGTSLNLGALARLCRSKKEAIRCDDAETDARAAGGDWKTWNARSVLMVPICEGDQVTGVMCAFSSSPAAFNQVHLAILKTIADELKELRKKSESVVRSRSIEIHPGMHEEIKLVEAQPNREVSVVIAAPPLPPAVEIRGAATKPDKPAAETKANSAGHDEIILDLTDAAEAASTRPALVEARTTNAAAHAERNSGAPAANLPSKKTVVLGSVAAPESSAKTVAPVPEKPAAAPVAAKAEPKPIVGNAAGMSQKPVTTTSAITPPPLASPQMKESSGAAASAKAGFTPMTAAAKAAAAAPSPAPKPILPAIKKKENEILPAAAEPFEFGMIPVRAPRPTTQTITLAGLENAAAGSETGRNKFMIPLAVTAVLAIGFAAWMLRGSLHASAASLITPPAVSQPAVQPAPAAPVAEPPATAAQIPATAPVQAEAQKSPVSNPSPGAQKQGGPAVETTVKGPGATERAAAMLPVVAESVSASIPKTAIVTTTVTPRTPASSQVIQPPTIAAVDAAPIPVIAAPVKVVSSVAHSTGATPAQVLTQVKPVYPMAAKIMHAQGTATLKVRIAKDGSVSEVSWVSGNTVFKDAAITAVREWKYKPATLNGEPAEATQEVTLKFLPQ